MHETYMKGTSKLTSSKPAQGEIKLIPRSVKDTHYFSQLHGEYSAVGTLTENLSHVPYHIPKERCYPHLDIKCSHTGASPCRAASRGTATRCCPAAPQQHSQQMVKGNIIHQEGSHTSDEYVMPGKQEQQAPDYAKPRKQVWWVQI